MCGSEEEAYPDFGEARLRLKASLRWSLEQRDIFCEAGQDVDTDMVIIYNNALSRQTGGHCGTFASNYDLAEHSPIATRWRSKQAMRSGCSVR